MPQIFLSLTIPRATPASQPVRVESGERLTYKKIYQAKLSFRPGTRMLVGARILTELCPVAPDPSSLNAWIIYDGQDVDFFWPNGFDLAGTPPKLSLEAYSLDQTYIRNLILMAVVDK